MIEKEKNTMQKKKTNERERGMRAEKKKKNSCDKLLPKVPPGEGKKLRSFSSHVHTSHTLSIW